MEVQHVTKLFFLRFPQAITLSRRGEVNTWALQNSCSVRRVNNRFILLHTHRNKRSSAVCSRVAIRRCLPLAFVTLVILSLTSHATTSLTIDYVYDDLNRLTGAARNEDTPMVIYHYDEVSNINWIATQNSPDTDVDGTPNFVDPDDDNDGISDDVELHAGLNPLLAADATGDLDGDGINNFDEHVLGSDINHFHGDIDSDGDLDLGDIIILKRITFERLPATEEQGESGHGDVNIDGQLDVGDLVIMQRLYFGNWISR